ncbi:MAG: ATP synthase F1 subunit delta [Minisyncoccia bacterium]
MAAISNNNIARAIYLALQGKDKNEQSRAYAEVVNFLAKRRLLSKAPDIMERLNKIINTEEGKIEAKIYTAKKLSDATRKNLARALSERYGGKEIILEEKLDERLLGGWRAEINDEVIDLSIKNKIKKLQAHLTKTI